MRVGASPVARDWAVKMNKQWFLLSGFSVITQRVAITIMKAERNDHFRWNTELKEGWDKVVNHSSLAVSALVPHFLGQGILFLVACIPVLCCSLLPLFSLPFFLLQQRAEKVKGAIGFTRGRGRRKPFRCNARSPFLEAWEKGRSGFW